MTNIIDLSAKKFQFTNAELVDGQIKLTLQYGNQVGQISIDANHRYMPEKLYEFVDVLDSVISNVAITMYEAEQVADLSVLNLYPGGKP